MGDNYRERYLKWIRDSPMLTSKLPKIMWQRRFTGGGWNEPS